MTDTISGSLDGGETLERQYDGDLTDVTIEPADGAVVRVDGEEVIHETIGGPTLSVTAQQETEYALAATGPIAPLDSFDTDRSKDWGGDYIGDRAAAGYTGGGSTDAVRVPADAEVIVAHTGPAADGSFETTLDGETVVSDADEHDVSVPDGADGPAKVRMTADAETEYALATDGYLTAVDGVIEEHDAVARSSAAGHVGNASIDEFTIANGTSAWIAHTDSDGSQDFDVTVAKPEPDRPHHVRINGSSGECDYAFETASTTEPEKSTADGASIQSNDTITELDDGRWRVEGQVNGGIDAFDLADGPASGRIVLSDLSGSVAPSVEERKE